MSRHWIQELSSELGSALITGPAADYAATDRSGFRPVGEPTAVVRARSIKEVQRAVSIANTHRIPVITRGAASGLAGGATAGAGSIVLDLRGLTRIIELDPQEGIAVVEPGVITADLDAAARRHGLFYAPDPGSVSISTIGGNIATNAGGLRGARYGVTRDAVLGLDVVLADGRLIHTGGRTIKRVTGYDLTALFTGSEGTLGIVVGATLRLLPVPGETATAAAYFPDVQSAAAAASTVIASGIRPATLELVDAETLRAIDEFTGSEYSLRGAALLLIQTDDYGAERQLQCAIAAIGDTPSRVDIASTAEETEQLLSARRHALPAVEAKGRVLIEDIAVPRQHLAAAIGDIRSIAATYGAETYIFAHAGDGNIHPIFVYQGHEHQIPEYINAAADEVFQLALRYGGTLTAEHGVGLLKKPWIHQELGDDVLGLSHAVKAVFDPRGILNPNKAI